MDVYAASESLGVHPRDMLRPDTMLTVAAAARACVAQVGPGTA
jgi:hypothetical protein